MDKIEFHECQRTRWKILGVLGTVSLACAGGIITILLGVRGDVSYVKGQVDTLVSQSDHKEKNPSFSVSDNGAVAQKQEHK